MIVRNIAGGIIGHKTRDPDLKSFIKSQSLYRQAKDSTIAKAYQLIPHTRAPALILCRTLDLESCSSDAELEILGKAP